MRGNAIQFPDYSFYPTARLLSAFVAGPDRLRSVTTGLAEADLRARPRGEESWSIHEIVLHVADSELQGTYRMRKVLAEPGSLLPGYDQAAWARAIEYQARDGRARSQSFALFAALREQTAELLGTLAEDAWQRTGVHPEYGPVTLRNLFELYADHSERHIEQILLCRSLLGKPAQLEALLARRLY